jgi:hypothetical protein
MSEEDSNSVCVCVSFCAPLSEGCVQKFSQCGEIEKALISAYVLCVRRRAWKASSHWRSQLHSGPYTMELFMLMYSLDCVRWNTAVSGSVSMFTETWTVYTGTV